MGFLDPSLIHQAPVRTLKKDALEHGFELHIYFIDDRLRSSADREEAWNVELNVGTNADITFHEEGLK